MVAASVVVVVVRVVETLATLGYGASPSLASAKLDFVAGQH